MWKQLERYLGLQHHITSAPDLDRMGGSSSRPLKKKGVGAARSRAGILLTAPAMLLLFGTIVYPLFWSLNLSLHSFDIINPAAISEFIGLTNYLEILSSRGFYDALFNTFGFVIASLTLELLIAFPIALLLHRGLPGTGLFRLIFSLPLMVAPIVAGLLWQFMFADQYGAVNNILSSLGIEGPLWLASVWGARAAVLIGNLWLATPFVILVLLAGMATLPDELFEAARIDGARGDQFFWYVMLPLLRPALLIILVVRLTDAIRVFDIVYILTGGGPGTATEVLSTYIYRETFTRLHFAQAAAASFIMLAITGLVSLGTIQVLRSRE